MDILNNLYYFISYLNPYSWNKPDIKDETSIQQAIDNWFEREPQGNSATLVKQRILNCLNNKTTLLDLNNVNVHSLPDIFHREELNFIKEISLAHSSIKELPENFNPKGLERFYFYYSNIKALPESFNPPHLKFFDATNSHLESLPENFNPESLETLYLTGSPISRLPLSWTSNHLTYLELSRTQISWLPESIFLLNDCIITLPIENFSNEYIQDIKNRFFRSGYRGPFFSNLTVSRGLNSVNTSPRAHVEVVFVTPLESRLKKIFEKAGLEVEKGLLKKLTQNQSQENKTNLKTWLSRLFSTASGRSTNTDKVHSDNRSFFKEVAAILQEAGSNENFRNNVFYRVLDEATKTCGDRVALSVLDLGIQKTLEQLDSDNPKEVANFLTKGVMTLDLLEDYARDIIPTLPGYSPDPLLDRTDPIEVYLGLPIKLREEFEIPINLKEMLYLSCSNLKDEHFDAARDKLQAALADEDKVLSFLIEQPKWLEVLKKARPEKMRELEETRDRRLEEDSFEKAEEILEEYNQGLKDLSKAVRRIERFSLRIRA